VRESYRAIQMHGAHVVAVGTGSVAQARRLVETGTPFPCLVDSQLRLYRLLGLGRVGVGTLLDPATYANYWRGWRHGARQGQVTGDPRQLSGVAILDAGGRLRWRHASRTVGDYPALADVLAALGGIVGSP